MSGTVSTRWYFSDWMSDANVRACGLAARGLWMDMLCIAAGNKGREYGFVLINGKVPSTAELARLVGSTEQEVSALLKELLDKGVPSIDRRRAFYCRRMVRAEKYRGNGRAGGNPNLKKTKENKKAVSPPIPEPEPEPSLFPPGPAAPVDERTKLWRDGLQTLVAITGKTPDAARKLVGKWLKEVSDDCTVLRRIIEDAQRNRIGEPIPWIEKAVRARSGSRDGRPARSGNAFAQLRTELRERMRGDDDGTDAEGSHGRGLVRTSHAH